MTSWGKPGRGKDFTIWANSGHMFMQSESGPKWRLDTGGPGGGNGARYSKQHRPTGGFQPRHWAGPASQLKDSKDSNKQEDPPSARDVIEDSGFGKLLFATLTEIGAWSENQIYIEELPTGIPEKVGRIFREFEGDNEAANEDFKTLLSDLIGTSSQGTGGGNESGSGAGSQDLVDGPVPKQVFMYFRGRGFTDEQAAGWVASSIPVTSEWNLLCFLPGLFRRDGTP